MHAISAKCAVKLTDASILEANGDKQRVTSNSPPPVQLWYGNILTGSGHTRSENKHKTQTDKRHELTYTRPSIVRANEYVGRLWSRNYREIKRIEPDTEAAVLLHAAATFIRFWRCKFQKWLFTNMSENISLQTKTNSTCCCDYMMISSATVTIQNIPTATRA